MSITSFAWGEPAWRSHAPETPALFVCGGGARNAHLMRSLAARLPALRVTTTAELGVPVLDESQLLDLLAAAGRGPD